MEEKQIRYNGSVIHYRSGGNGNPLVLLHGFGEDGNIWKHQLDALRDYHLIIPDLPGSGASEMIPDMSMEGMAHMLQQLLVHELATVFFKQGQPQSVVLIGHSMGGYISLAFAEKYPAMLRGLGLYHSSAYADTAEKIATRKRGINFIREHGAYEFLKTAIPHLYTDYSRKNRPEMVQKHLASTSNLSQEALVSYYENMIARPDRTEVLKTLTVPVFFLLGKHDGAVLLQDGLQQAHLPQISYIHVLENTAHMGMAEQPGEANHHLLSFLQLVNQVA